MCHERSFIKTNYWVGGFLLVVGVVWFLTKAGGIPGSIWGYFWPAVLVVAGLHILLRGCKNGHQSYDSVCCDTEKDGSDEPIVS